MSTWFGQQGRRTALQRSVRKYAPIIAKFRRTHPDRPLRECLPGWCMATLRKLLPEGTHERDRLDEILSPQRPCDDPVEFCCRLVSLGHYTSIVMGNGALVRPGPVGITTGNAYAVALALQVRCQLAYALRRPAQR